MCRFVFCIQLHALSLLLKDVTDLFGSDLPVEGGEAGQFVWRDGPLLKALKAGSWIVLDEVFCFVIFCLLPHDDFLQRPRFSGIRSAKQVCKWE